MTRPPLLICALLALPGPALAEGPVAHMRLLEGWREGASHFAGVEVTLSPGWKTYWRAPGEAGIPPQFDWSGSSNLAAARIHWPVPTVFDQAGMTSIGYHDAVVFPVEITPADPAAPVTLDLALDIGVCKEVCVPVRAAARANLTVEAGRKDARIRSALADRPLSAAEAGVEAIDCATAPTEDGVTLTARLDMAPVGRGEYAVIEAGDPQLWVSEATLDRTGDRVEISAEIVPPPGAPLTLSRDALRLTILGSDGAVDIRGCG